MKEKLEYLMNHTGLRVGEIADKLGVKTPVISHLLKGRNKPNFILTGKIIATFTEFSPLWWLGLSDDPFAQNSNSSAPKNLHTPTPTSEVNSSTQIDSAEQTLFNTFESLAPMLPSRPTSEIERVIIFYKDNSFESFTPKK